MIYFNYTLLNKIRNKFNVYLLNLSKNTRDSSLVSSVLVIRKIIIEVRFYGREIFRHKQSCGYFDDW